MDFKVNFKLRILYLLQKYNLYHIIIMCFSAILLYFDDFSDNM